MNQAVEDSVGDSRITDVFVPVFERKLTKSEWWGRCRGGLRLQKRLGIKESEDRNIPRVEFIDGEYPKIQVSGGRFTSFAGVPLALTFRNLLAAFNDPDVYNLAAGSALILYAGCEGLPMMTSANSGAPMWPSAPIILWAATWLRQPIMTWYFKSCCSELGTVVLKDGEIHFGPSSR